MREEEFLSRWSRRKLTVAAEKPQEVADLEVEVHAGGQPLYPFIIGME